MSVEVRESPNVDSRSLFAGERGFYQRSARRANGDTVFITGDFQWEVEHCRRLLMKLARRHRLMMIEIAELAGLPTGRISEMPQLALLECEPSRARAEIEARIAELYADGALLDGRPLLVGTFLDVCQRITENTLFLIRAEADPAQRAAWVELLEWWEGEIVLALRKQGLIDG